EPARSVDCDSDRKIQRVTVGAAADRGKADRRETVRYRKLERAPIARGEELRLAMAPASPHRSDRVDDVARGQSIAGRELRVSGRASSQRPALRQQLRARRAVNRSIYPAAAEQRRVGRVDDRVDGERGDVGLNGGKRGCHLSPTPAWGYSSAMASPNPTHA